MKNQIRYMENNPRSSKQQLSVAAAVTSNIKMEDEETELFNNDFLDDLKSGIQTSPTGRNSVRYNFKQNFCENFQKLKNFFFLLDLVN